MLDPSAYTPGGDETLGPTSLKAKGFSTDHIASLAAEGFQGQHNYFFNGAADGYSKQAFIELSRYATAAGAAAEVKRQDAGVPSFAALSVGGVQGAIGFVGHDDAGAGLAADVYDAYYVSRGRYVAEVLVSNPTPPKPAEGLALLKGVVPLIS